MLCESGMRGMDMKFGKLSTLVLASQLGLVGCVTVNEEGNSPVVKADPVSMAESRICLLYTSDAADEE